MQYTTTITSKGTTTIPAEIRQKLGLSPGGRVTFDVDPKTGYVIIRRAMTIDELHAMNRAAMERAGTWPPSPYRSGDGMAAYVKKKYGTNGK